MENFKSKNIYHRETKMIETKSSESYIRNNTKWAKEPEEAREESINKLKLDIYIDTDTSETSDTFQSKESCMH